MEIKVTFDIFIGYGIPLIAIAISIASFHASKKVTKVQLRLNEMEVKMKKYELEEIEKVREAANKSKVEARICNVSKGKYRLKIWNSGQVEAYDVDFQVPEELKGIVFRDKVPFEVLEPGKSFEEHIIVYNGIPRKFTMKTTWKDSNGVAHDKEQIVTF